MGYLIFQIFYILAACGAPASITDTGAAATAGGLAAQGAVAGSIVGGFSSAINGGDMGDVLRGAAIGAAQGAISGGILHPMNPGSGGLYSNTGQAAVHIAGHGIVGGAANAAMGGKFGDGFLSAAASAGFADAGAYGFTGGTDSGAVAARTTVAGIVGGTASVLGGGKFANGAYTAAFQHLVNMEFNRPLISHEYDGVVAVDPAAPKGWNSEGNYDFSTNKTTFDYGGGGINWGQPTDPTFAILSIYAGDKGMSFGLRSLGAGFLSVFNRSFATESGWFYGRVLASEAGKEAMLQGARTIEMTQGGAVAGFAARTMGQLGFSYRTIRRVIWVPASRAFATNTSAFGGLSGPGGAIWRVVERPILIARGLIK